MAYSVQTAKSELSAMLHGTDLGQVENIDGVLNRAARQLLLDIDPAETKVQIPMATPVYDGVYDYSAPDDLKGNKVIDLATQISRNQRDRFTQTYNQNFDIYKSIGLQNNFTVFQNKGKKTLRIAYNNSSRSILINNCNSILGNGTWATSGTASNLSEDSQSVDNNNSVLKFDITTGTGYVSNSTIAPIDMTNHLNQSRIFFDVYLPKATDFTSLEIRFGSDSSNYYEATGVVTNFQGNSFNSGWNTIGILWSAMTKVGNPVVSTISYVRLGFITTADNAGVEFAQIWSRLGFIMNIEYYSKFLFQDEITGAWLENLTDDSNLINLDTDSYNLFIYQAAFLCVQQALGQDAGYDTNIFMDKYNNALIRYKRCYKSEISKVQEPYYRRTFSGYSNYLGRNSITY
jgi:hypothetical protein